MAKKRKLSHQAKRYSKPNPGPPKQKDPQKDRDPRNKHNTARKNEPKPDQADQKQSHIAHSSQDDAIVPFGPANRILLVGEADLGFAASLVRHHGCLHITATVFEADAAELEAKYPDTAAANTRIVTEAAPTCRVLYGVDACDRGPFRIPGRSKSRKKRKRGPLSSAIDDFNVAEPSPVGAGAVRDSVDDDIWDRIAFNFPHVGGKSKDVNRQVRYNQELLVAFFDRAKQSLAPGGAIVVTVFEGEPYSLWNVRDLGRHCGLRVERSFRFCADAYPGYHHARTLGVVRNKRTGEVATTAWRGENRPARCFVMVRREDEDVQIEGVSFVSRKKRKREGDSDGEDEEDEEDYGEYDSGEDIEEDIEEDIVEEGEEGGKENIEEGVEEGVEEDGKDDGKEDGGEDSGD